MARISALDRYPLDLRRAAVTLAIVAAHVALIVVMLRSAGHSADVVDITLFALPINPEDRPREPVHVQKPPISRALETAPRRAAVARESATQQREEPSLGQPATPAGVASEPASPIDWHAEIETSAHALAQHDSIESGRRSLAGPTQPALSAPPKSPECPFERCEPGWGTNLGLFEALRSKAGRIEKIPDDRPTALDGSPMTTDRPVVQWINNWCYKILVSQDRARRGQIWCGVPIGKKPEARGDLFDHMDKDRPPQPQSTDVP